MSETHRLMGLVAGLVLHISFDLVIGHSKGIGKKRVGEEPKLSCPNALKRRIFS